MNAWLVCRDGDFRVRLMSAALQPAACNPLIRPRLSAKISISLMDEPQNNLLFEVPRLANTARRARSAQAAAL